MCAAVALANLDVFEEEGILENVRAQEPASAACSSRLRDIPIVGDVRGAASSTPSSSSRTATQGVRSTRAESEGTSCPRPSSPASVLPRGLICRADDRGDPVIQLSPPLIAGPARFFDEKRVVLRPRPQRAASASRPRPLVRGPVLTVRDLLFATSGPRRRPASQSRTARPLVHISEGLPDPTPWLSAAACC
jgi:hypothetical protein